jgi:lipopolysaccharide transport system permease protein
VVTAGPASGTPTIVRPPGRWPPLGFRELWRFRSISVVLAQRSFKARYRQTALGVAWVLLQPLLLAAVFTVFFGILGRLTTDNIPFPLFYYSGVMLWQIFAKGLNEGGSSLVTNGALIKRVYFPRAYFPVSVVMVSVVDLLVDYVPLFLLLLIFHIVPGPTVLVVPLLIVVLLASSLGGALWLSALNTTYRDIGALLPVIIQMWFFLSPIIYPASIVPAAYQWLYYLNPIALVVTGSRWAIVGGPPPPPESWILSVGVALLLLVSGYVYFRHREPTVADVL